MQTELKKKEKQETLKRLVEQEQNSVASLEATYKSMLKENADREKEYSALKAARKAAQLRAVRLQKHVKEEEKKHKELLQRIKKQQEPTVSVTSKGPTVGRLLKNMFSTTKSVKSQGSILSVESGSVASSKVLSDEPDVSDAYNEPVSPHENRQDIGTATRSSISEDVERLGLSPDKKRRPVLNRIGHAMHLTGSKRGYASEKPREKKTDVLDDRGKAAIVARDDGSVSGGRADQGTYHSGVPAVHNEQLLLLRRPSQTGRKHNYHNALYFKKKQFINCCVVPSLIGSVVCVQCYFVAETLRRAFRSIMAGIPSHRSGSSVRRRFFWF